MIKSKKWLSVLTSAAILVSIATGCGGSTETSQPAPAQGGETAGKAEDKGKEPVELRLMWWGSQDRHDRTLKVIEMYQQENPHVTIKPEFLSFDGYWEKLTTQVAGKKMPDVVQMDYKFLNDYVSRGTLLDMNPLVEKGLIDLSDSDANAVDGGKVDGKLYALNLGSNTTSLGYDPELFEKAGVELPPGYTWDDLAKVSRQIKEKLGIYGVEPFEDMKGFQQHLRSHGLNVYSKTGDGLGYDDDKYLVDYFSFWRGLVDEGAAAPIEDWVQTANQLENRMMVHQKAASGSVHSNQIKGLMKGAGRTMGVTTYPAGPGDQKAQFLKPSQFFSIAATTKHPEEAAKFINFFTNDLEANEILAAERGVPISKKVRDHLKPQMDESGKIMFDYLEVAAQHSREIDPPDPKGASEIENLFKRINQEVHYKQSTPEAAAKKFRDEATKILKEANAK
ncbi:ABC transporter substrate-binding protein [Ammoniphilus sp. 3BR4]|uniref:ABC transporter substrate-binding protein n=1 Tax=Ammoniphilus sp. 3BR4 TaxID=3158265 RepID=UPI0034662106